MAVAISLKALNDSAKHIEALWQKAGNLETRPSMISMNYPPHITLAIYDSIDPLVLKQAARQVFAGKRPVRITFDAIRYFDVDPMVLWAAPKDACDPMELHQEVHKLIDPNVCRLHYRPAEWISHCTLATGIEKEKRPQALSLAQSPIAPFEVIFDTADCIEFPPVQVVEEYPLDN